MANINACLFFLLKLLQFSINHGIMKHQNSRISRILMLKRHTAREFIKAYLFLLSLWSGAASLYLFVANPFEKSCA